MLGGLTEARDVARDAGMRFVDGVEVSVTWRGQTIHIVGLDIDPSDPQLTAGLARVRASRQARAARIAEQLEAAGISGALEGAYAYADDPTMIGRTHFARHLVAAGHASDTAAVFRRYLTPGRIGYVPNQWAALADAVQWIRAAGGHAIVAHPGRYGVSRPVLEALVAEFKGAGGTGIEVITGSHSPDQYADFGRLARQLGLLASCGSDFHGPNETRIDLGGLPALDQSVPSILAALGEPVE